MIYILRPGTPEERKHWEGVRDVSLWLFCSPEPGVLVTETKRHRLICEVFWRWNHNHGTDNG